MSLLARLWAFIVALFRQPAPAPATDPLVDRLAKEILFFNNGRGAFIPGPIYTNPVKGVILHEIGSDQANTVAAALLRHLALDDYFCAKVALIGSESAFDPSAQNGNLGPGESNTANEPGGYDVGLCQFKLKYLSDDIDKAREMAMNLDEAIPAFDASFLGKVATAKLVQSELSKNCDPNAHNPAWLAVLSYKYGPTGSMQYANSNTVPRNAAGKTEPDQVADIEQLFASALGMRAVLR